jgi:tetratricopeptide (TPR) repeat protein
LAHTLLGISLHLIGELKGARVELEAALQHGPGARRASTIHFNNGHHIPAGATLARTLWLQGHPAQALDRARQTVKEAASMEVPVPLAAALSLAVSVFLWTGDLESAEEYIDWYISLTESHSLGIDLKAGHGYKGQLAIRRGDAAGGVETLRGSLAELRATGFELIITPFNIPLVQGLAALGQFAEGLALVDETIQRSKTNGDLVYMPELLRVKGGLLLSVPALGDDDAGECFMQSLALSRSQGALSWELRTATSLAELWCTQGRADEAHGVLAPVYSRFTEGFDTVDLTTAKRLLDELA